MHFIQCAMNVSTIFADLFHFGRSGKDAHSVGALNIVAALIYRSPRRSFINIDMNITSFEITMCQNNKNHIEKNMKQRE